MDVMVLQTQQWLNETYGNDNRFQHVEEDGFTGWKTIHGLIRALQIELGITATADSFGPGTTAKFTQRFPNGIHQQDDNSQEENNVYAIIQGSLWCKGYSTGYSSITRKFKTGTGAAIKRLKGDMGFLDPNACVTLNVMKALLSMDQFVLIRSQGGTEQIRSIQQKLNLTYEAYIGITPCDGLYNRAMNKALIYVLQAVEGQSPAEADGSFGPGTKAKLPILPDSKGVLSAQQIQKATELIRFALVCNGFTVPTEGVWDAALEKSLGEFQDSMMLPITRMADTNTWMSLLLSKGNPDRPAIACDTRFEMTAERLAVLKNKGYEIVGRYLTGSNFKVLRAGELDRILAAGLKFFPIFQESGTDISYFTTVRGRADAYQAVRAARKFRLKAGTVIYFATDLDPNETQIKSYILPYFTALRQAFDREFLIGVYGTRNVCSTLLKNGYCDTCFVSDMSTGFSGNMGFKMPSNWTFDQFAEISMGTDSTGETWAIDKDAYSGQFDVVSELEPKIYKQPDKTETKGLNSILSKLTLIESLESLCLRYLVEENPNNYTPTPAIVAKKVLGFMRRKGYSGFEWAATNVAIIDEKFVQYVETKDPDLFASFEQCLGELLCDSADGAIELPHLSATTECYLSATLFPDAWAGWVGDVASGMKTVTQKRAEDTTGKSVQDLADELIGHADQGTSACNYPDFCMDADAIRIAELIKESDSVEHALSDALRSYYTGMHEKRFFLYPDSMNCTYTLSALKETIFITMTSLLNFVPIILKGETLDTEVIKACCDSFAKYIYEELK